MNDVLGRPCRAVALVTVLARLRDAGGSLMVVCDNEDVRSIFATVGLDSMRLAGTALCGSAMNVSSVPGVQVMPLRFIARENRKSVDVPALRSNTP